MVVPVWTMATVLAAGVGSMPAGRSVSAAQAIEAEYSRYVAHFRSHRPQDLGDFYQAAMTWRGLRSAPTYQSVWALPPGEASSTASLSNGQIAVTVDRLDVAGRRAVAVITKRVTGWYKAAPDQPAGALAAVSRERQVWVADGARWLPMTSEPVSAVVTLNGEVFRPNRQLRFDPNRSFRADQQTPLTGADVGRSAP